VTSSEEEQRLLRSVLDRHPDAKALIDQRKAKEPDRQQVFDAMDLPELREAAIAALTSAAEVIMNLDPTASASDDDWTAENRRNLAGHHLKMVESIDADVDIRGSFNMAKWFDFFPIEDELETVAYEAAEVYTAYLKRKSS
jgi:hypothetical protein